jgi:hypothetical protein
MANATTCTLGVLECAYAARFAPAGAQCAAYDGGYQHPEDLRWLVMAGGVTMILMVSRREHPRGNSEASNAFPLSTFLVSST